MGSKPEGSASSMIEIMLKRVVVLLKALRVGADHGHVDEPG